MAYEEVGGCRELSGFFHGECPIQETGRQSYANKGTEVYAFWRNYAVFCLCKSNFLHEPRIVVRFLGFIYGQG